MQITFFVLASFAAAFTATAMIWDLRTRRLPNWLTVSAFFAAIIFHVATAGLPGLGTALGGFGVGFGILFALWLIGGGGGGDVKLMGALGAWLGAPLTLIVFLLSVVIALAATSAIFVWQMINQSASRSKSNSNTACEDKDGQFGRARHLIPYAVPVALATWSVLILKIFAMTLA